MKIVFRKDCINYNNKQIEYDKLGDNQNNNEFFNLLEYCTSNEDQIEFEQDDDTSEFGKKLMEILQNEFVKHN